MYLVFRVQVFKGLAPFISTQMDRIIRQVFWLDHFCLKKVINGNLLESARNQVSSSLVLKRGIKEIISSLEEGI